MRTIFAHGEVSKVNEVSEATHDPLANFRGDFGERAQALPHPTFRSLLSGRVFSSLFFSLSLTNALALAQRVANFLPLDSKVVLTQ